MPDVLIQEFRIPFPRRGIVDSVDSSIPEYPPDAAPVLVNLRVSGLTLQTRKGMAVFKALPGSGDCRMLADHYEISGKRIRLAARGTGAAAALYDYVEGTDSAFQSVSGGTGLGGTTQPYFQMTTLGDAAYITDRNGPLKKYVETPASGNQLTTVAQPVAPGAAPGVKARPYAILETWQDTGGTSLGWTESDNTTYALTDTTATLPPPIGAKTARLRIFTAAAATKTITQNVTAEALSSGQIAFWIRQTRNRYHEAFQFGLVSATDFSQKLRADKPDEWYPVFIDVGTLPSINFKRFQVVDDDPPASSAYVTQMFLPGLLDGKYRWVYTHYDPTSGRESSPSPISNAGTPIDLSAPGVTGQSSTAAAALNKSAVLTFVSDSGVDSSTTKIRIYRNGGVSSLTIDATTGREVWCRVGEVNDRSTTFSNSPAAGATSFTVNSATGLAIGDTVVLDKGGTGGGTNSEEYVYVQNLAGTTVTPKTPLLFGHTITTSTVQIAFNDNVANENVDRTLVIQRERNDPPTGILFIQKSPDGRLWAFTKAAVYVSNRATPDRPIDYEVFPTGVDPQTRKDPLQGWSFNLYGDDTEEAIIWGGFYRGVATILTRKHLFVINAQAQADWGPSAIQRLHETGCIAGDTVAEVGGVLYWVADGPRVMRWDGRGEPQEVSFQRVSAALEAAPAAYWNYWFARRHAAEDGAYYRLWLVPAGGTTPTDRLDFNQALDAWESATYYDDSAVKRGWAAASVRGAFSDTSELYAVSTQGTVYHLETGNDDAGIAIRVSYSSRRFPTGAIGLAHTAFARAEAADDTFSLVVLAGGSEYGDTTHTYSLPFNATVDEEQKQRLHRDLLGRWLQASVSGSVSNRPALHELRLLYVHQRAERKSA